MGPGEKIQFKRIAILESQIKRGRLWVGTASAVDLRERVESAWRPDGDEVFAHRVRRRLVPRSESNEPGWGAQDTRHVSGSLSDLTIY